MFTDLDIKIDQWVATWTPFIRKYAKGLAFLHTDEDDWLQAARKACWEALDRFDASRGRPFDSYALDGVKRRLIDLKRKEGNQNRFWLRGSAPIDQISGRCNIHDKEPFCLNSSKDSDTILRLLCAEHSPKELECRLGIPREWIDNARDEAAQKFVEGGYKMMRKHLEERAREVGITPVFDEDDFTLASRILSAGKSAARTFKIVPAPPPKKRRKSSTDCVAEECVNLRSDDSRFCSLSCAEIAFSTMENTLASAKQAMRIQRVGRSGVSTADGVFIGDHGDQAIAALANPFNAGSSAHEAFELFRDGGTKGQLIQTLDQRLREKEIACSNIPERIRRVVTDTRKLGYELERSKAGVFRLTGRTRS